MLYSQLIQNKSRFLNMNSILENMEVYKDVFHTYTKKNTSTTLVKYKKKKLWEVDFAEDLEKTQVLRSCILKDGFVIGFSPMKAKSIYELTHTLPLSSYVQPNVGGMYFEEMVEGTMINVSHTSRTNYLKEQLPVYDVSDSENQTTRIEGDWVISTRSIIGATNKYFKHYTKTFGEMFMETLQYVGITLDDLSKDYSYSFVIKHPDNRIINTVYEPELYLVGLYKSHFDDSIKQESDTPSPHTLLEIVDYRTSSYGRILQEKGIKVPIRYYSLDKYVLENDIDMDNEQTNDHIFSLISQYHSISYVPSGVYFTNGVVSYKLRNHTYCDYQKLKGNQPKLQYTFLDMWKNSKVQAYLNMFPEYTRPFTQYSEQLKFFATILYQNYVNCFIKKEAHVKTYPFELRVHMCGLHGIYLNEKNSNTNGRKNNITMERTFEYLKTIPTAKLMYFLNYNQRPEVVKQRYGNIVM